jgi:integrase
MSSVARRPDGRWRARYRDTSGREHAKHFKRKVDAQTWLDSVTSARVSGTYVDPRVALVTVGEWAALWLAGQVHLKASSRARTEGIVTKHVTHRWAAVKLRDVSHAEVQSWVAELRGSGLSASSVRRIHGVLAQVLELAVRDRRLATNPARGVSLPRVVSRPARFLTAEQVETLANECGDSGLLVRFLAYTGLRWGEATALLVGDLDFDRRRIHVARAASEVEGRLLLDTTKTNKSRVVALPGFLAEELMTATTGKKPDHLVFGNRRGGLLRNRNFTTRVLAPAAAEVGLNGLTVHALRHTAA